MLHAMTAPFGNKRDAAIQRLAEYTHPHKETHP